MFLQTPTPEPIAVIEVLLQRNTIMEIMVIVFPVFTLIIGFLLSYGVKIIEDRRKITNLKKIITGEVLENFVHLKQMRAFVKDDEIKLVIELSNFLSFSVYNAYLDRIDLLKEDDIMVLSAAYRFTRAVVHVCEMYSDLITNPKIIELLEVDPNYIQYNKEGLAKGIESAIKYNTNALLIIRMENDVNIDDAA